MEKLPENDLEPIEATVIKTSTGYLLRSARESQGMSIEDVVAKTKLAPRQIIALEADDFKALPELAFIRGFVRSYAKILQLDVQPLLDGLPGAAKEKVEPLQLEVAFSAEKTRRQQNINWLSAALVVVLLIGAFVIWQGSTERTATSVEAIVATASGPEILAGTDSEVSAASSLEVPVVTVSEVSAAAISASVAAQSVAQPVAAVSEPAVAVPVEKTALRLVFDKASWAQIKDQAGKTLSRQVNLAGSELRVEGVAPFTLIIGHAASVHLFLREKPIDMSAYVNAGSDVARMTLK